MPALVAGIHVFEAEDPVFSGSACPTRSETGGIALAARKTMPQGKAVRRLIQPIRGRLKPAPPD
jgi:hypothetical protein